MHLYRDLNVTQRTAWYLLHRIRQSKHAKDKLRAGRGTAGKTPVAGVKNRETKQVQAKVIEEPDEETLQEFISDRVKGSVTQNLNQFAG